MEEDEIVNCDLDVSVPFAKFETEELWPVLCGTAMWACDDHNRIKHWDSALKRCSQNFDGYSIVALSVDITMEGDDLGEMILNYDTPHRRKSVRPFLPNKGTSVCRNGDIPIFHSKRIFQTLTSFHPTNTHEPVRHLAPTALTASTSLSTASAIGAPAPTDS